MHKIKNNNSLPVFQPSFTEVNSKYKTKSSHKFYKPFCNTKLAQYAITYRGPYLWNSIIDGFKNCKTFLLKCLRIR